MTFALKVSKRLSESHVVEPVQHETENSQDVINDNPRLTDEVNNVIAVHQTPRKRLLAESEPKPLKKRKQPEVFGDQAEIRSAVQSMSETVPGAGIECTFYDYTYCKAIPNVLLKLSRNRRSLLIMTKDIEQHRASGSRIGCCGCLPSKDRAILPKTGVSPI